MSKAARPANRPVVSRLDGESVEAVAALVVAQVQDEVLHCVETVIERAVDRRMDDLGEALTAYVYAVANRRPHLAPLAAVAGAEGAPTDDLGPHAIDAGCGSSGTGAVA
jgi:hypothetical protein